MFGRLVVRSCWNAFCVFTRGLLWYAFCIWILQWQCTCCCWRIPKAFSLSKDSVSTYIYANSPDFAWYWEDVRKINTRENILEMVQRSPRLSTGRMNGLSHWRITYAGVANWVLSGTRRPCSAYGFVPLCNSSSRTVKRNFIQWWGVFYPGLCK
jgi:hypothetical protein